MVSGNDDASDVVPPAGGSDDEPRARRTAGVRTPVSESVLFEAEGRRIDGWTLNLSRGGIRAILDDMVEMGEEFEITVGTDAEPRAGRVVWVREDKGGCIVGVAFLDSEGSVPPPPGASEPPHPPQAPAG
ncbi:MAG TPA: PilZ domain-containing protein [Polyangiaceae bacterium]|nr:PilZ domain-containing protein [Polyangiaceae bacterium]